MDLAQVIWRSAIPFLRKYVVPAAKRIGVDIFEFAAPEIREVINGKKIFQDGCKECGKANSEKDDWVAVVNRGESFQQNLLSNPVDHEETFLQTLIVDHVKQHLSVPMFCGSVWKS